MDDVAAIAEEPLGIPGSIFSCADWMRATVQTQPTIVNTPSFRNGDKQEHQSTPVLHLPILSHPHANPISPSVQHK
jgi:hypothetical protein